MSRRQMIVLWVIFGAVAVAGLGAVMIHRRRPAPQVPEWLAGGQPPDSVAPDLMTLTPDQSWAANRARPMVACCGDYTAGRRIRRTYPRSLAESPDSFIAASFDLSGGL